ncbi:MAG: NAD(P)-dependent oxidoreductase [Algibacter sp.]
MKNNNVALKNIKVASMISVAEHAVCLVIMGLHNIAQGLKSIDESKWEKTQLIGNEIKNKTIGFIGFGNIGQDIAELLDKFNVNIIYTNKTRLIDNLTYEYLELLELVKKLDVISVQVALSFITIQVPTIYYC